MQASSAVISFQLEDWGKQYDWAVVDSGLVKSYYEDIGYFRYLFTYPGRRFSEYEIRFPAGARATTIRTRPFWQRCAAVRGSRTKGKKCRTRLEESRASSRAAFDEIGFASTTMPH